MKQKTLDDLTQAELDELNLWLDTINPFENFVESYEEYLKENPPTTLIKEM